WCNGDVWLGHRRLAIIDLSPGGHQPMVDVETGVTITFNGEIFNYVELRDELRALGHTFQTRSDTEVLLKSYLAWKHECLHHLNGMWHFVIWDPRDRTVFMARDRLGVKPCYYSLHGGRLIVASEPKAIVAIEPAHRRVDYAALRDFLMNYALYASDHSFYQGIWVLPAAHRAIFRVTTGDLRVERYWSPAAQTRSEPSQTNAEEFAALISDSVRLRMRSDVPVGLTLSGGLDSTTLLTEAIKHTNRLVAFTSVYGDAAVERNASEENWARMAVSHFDGVALECVDANVDHWIKTLREIAWHLDGPTDSPAVFPLWRIMERARKVGVPVLLDGQGADELLGGYVQYAALDALQRISAAVREPLPALLRTAGQALKSYAKTFQPGRLAIAMMRAQFPALLPLYRSRFSALGALRDEFVGEYMTLDTGAGSSWHSSSASRVQERLLDDLQHKTLPGLLQYGDAVSMAHSIEVRVPFLDYRLVELCVSLPMSFKIADGQTKRVLRSLLHRAGVHEIAERRDKKGYPTPVNAWLAARNGQIARDILLAPGAHIHEFCDPRRLARLVKTHLLSINNTTGYQLYRLISTELWLQECVSGPASAGPPPHRVSSPC
ncbi:MAG TPA: asparagine synthase (glutamine-hydrolyzing), partial [Nitrospira sp.]|nr:asparagine synthase (glutamine-hydrolyzing) [Nitrospira sp.]